MLELLYLFAGYYSVLTAVMFFTLGNYAAALEKPGSALVRQLFNMVLAFFLGMQGMRGILMIFGPLFCVECMRFTVLRLEKKTYSPYRRVGIWVISLLACSYLGSKTPFSVGTGMTRNIRHGFQKLVTVVLPDAAMAVGLISSNRFVQLSMTLLVFLAICMFAGVLRKIVCRKHLSPFEWIYVFLVVSPVMSAFCVAFTTVDSSFRYYYIFNFALAFSVVLALELLPSGSKRQISAACIGGAAVLILTFANMKELYLPMMLQDASAGSSFGRVAACLEENEIEHAYATFEHANAITFISDGKVNVAPVASVETMDMCKWLSSTRWYPPNEPYERITAYIVTDNEAEQFAAFLQDDDRAANINELSKIGKYTIYVSDYNYGRAIE